MSFIQIAPTYPSGITSEFPVDHAQSIGPILGGEGDFLGVPEYAATSVREPLFD